MLYERTLFCTSKLIGIVFFTLLYIGLMCKYIYIILLRMFCVFNLLMSVMKESRMSFGGGVCCSNIHRFSPCKSFG